MFLKLIVLCPTLIANAVAGLNCHDPYEGWGASGVYVFERMSTDKPWSYDTNSLTLQRYLLAEQSLYPKASGELTKLITSLLIGFKSISSVVRRNGFLNLHDITAKTNQVEEAKNLDVLSNEILINIITSSLACGGMISQKDDAVTKVDEIKTGNYILCFDPLNGSSDIDCMLPMASIFGIWIKRTEGMTPATEDDFMQPGRWLVAAGYCIYGSATMVVISTGSGVDGFTLDPSIGEFLLTHPKITLPEKGKIFSISNENIKDWSAGLTAYIHDRKFPQTGKKTMSERYFGSMVADVHRTLLYGGICLYPPTKDAPNGELRLLCQCAPIAFIVEQAGGHATSGKRPILHITPKDIHQRCPFYVGSKKDVEELLTYLDKE